MAMMEAGEGTGMAMNRVDLGGNNVPLCGFSISQKPFGRQILNELS